MGLTTFTTNSHLMPLVLTLVLIMSVVALSLSIYNTTRLHRDHLSAARHGVNPERVLGQAYHTHTNDQGSTIGTRNIPGITFTGQGVFTPVLYLTVPNITAGTVVDLKGIVITFELAGVTWTNTSADNISFPSFTVTNLFGSTVSGSTQPQATDYSDFVVRCQLGADATVVYEGKVPVDLNGTHQPKKADGSYVVAGTLPKVTVEFSIFGFVWPEVQVNTKLPLSLSIDSFAGQTLTGTQIGSVDICHTQIVDVIQTCYDP